MTGAPRWPEQNPYEVGDVLICTDFRENPAEARSVVVTHVSDDILTVENTRTGRTSKLTWPRLKKDWRPQ